MVGPGARRVVLLATMAPLAMFLVGCGGGDSTPAPTEPPVTPAPVTPAPATPSKEVDTPTPAPTPVQAAPVVPETPVQPEPVQPVQPETPVTPPPTPAPPQVFSADCKFTNTIYKLTRKGHPTDVPIGKSKTDAKSRCSDGHWSTQTHIISTKDTPARNGGCKKNLDQYTKEHCPDDAQTVNKKETSTSVECERKCADDAADKNCRAKSYQRTCVEAENEDGDMVESNHDIATEDFKAEGEVPELDRNLKPFEGCEDWIEKHVKDLEEFQEKAEGEKGVCHRHQGKVSGGSDGVSQYVV